MGGITSEHARFLYDDAVERFEELPVPAEKGLQGVLDRENDPGKNADGAGWAQMLTISNRERRGLGGGSDERPIRKTICGVVPSLASIR